MEVHKLQSAEPAIRRSGLGGGQTSGGIRLGEALQGVLIKPVTVPAPLLAWPCDYRPRSRPGCRGPQGDYWQRHNGVPGNRAYNLHPRSVA